MPQPKAATTRRLGQKSLLSEPKDLKLTFVMIATLVVWIFKIIHFWLNHGQQLANQSGASTTTALEPYAFFNLLHGITKVDWGGHLAIAAFIVVHHLRMAVGVEFAGRDGSFFRAKLHAPFETRTSREWIESLLLAAVVSLSVLLTYFVGEPDYIGSALLLLGQGILLVLYDAVFRKALLKYDEDRSANRFIVIWDCLFLLVTLIIVGNRIVRGSQANPAFNDHFGTVVLILCVAYAALFFVETFFAYLAAIKSAVDEIRTAFGYLATPSLWWNGSNGN